jgi:putative Mg2+ transporter-C (MgtC) family protein
MLSQLTNIDWHQIVHHLWHLAFAYALAIPIGLDREQSQRHFGLRTFPLVAGTASAASIWNTGAIGLAVAFNRFEIAIVLSLLNFITLWAVGRFKRNLPDKSRKD